MSVWVFVFLLIALQNSAAHTEDARDRNIGEQLDIIIKDVSDYLFWLFGYNEEVSIEDQIEASETMREEFIKDVTNMVEMMHTAADEHIKHATDIKKIEQHEDNRDDEKNISDDSGEKHDDHETKGHDDKVKSDVKINHSSEKTNEDTKDEQGSGIKVIPL